MNLNRVANIQFGLLKTHKDKAEGIKNTFKTILKETHPELSFDEVSPEGYEGVEKDEVLLMPKTSKGEEAPECVQKMFAQFNKDVDYVATKGAECFGDKAKAIHKGKLSLVG